MTRAPRAKPCRTSSACLIALALLVVPGPLAAAQSELELALKATYLVKFLPFVRWPDRDGPSGAFPICVVGQDPFGSLLDRAAANQSVGGLPIIIRRYSVLPNKPACGALYIAQSNPDDEAATLATIRGQAVLTVTDQAFDPKVKGVINFVVDDNRVRFEIDQIEAREDGLSISSKLLSLAVAVRSREQPR